MSTLHVYDSLTNLPSPGSPVGLQNSIPERMFEIISIRLKAEVLKVKNYRTLFQIAKETLPASTD